MKINTKPQLIKLISLLLVFITIVAIIPFMITRNTHGQATVSAKIVSPEDIDFSGEKEYIIFTNYINGKQKNNYYAIGSDGKSSQALIVNSIKEGEIIESIDSDVLWTFRKNEYNHIIVENTILQNKIVPINYNDNKHNHSIMSSSSEQGIELTNKKELTARINLAPANSHVENYIILKEAAENINFLTRCNKCPKASEFYFAEVIPEEKEIITPSILPKEEFKAEIVDPNQLYGDEEYVIFTQLEDGKYYAINRSGMLSEELKVESTEIGSIIISPDNDTLWNFYKNYTKEPDENLGNYRYIKNVASQLFLSLAPQTTLLTNQEQSDLLVEITENSFKLTDKTQYVNIVNSKLSKSDEGATFYAAKILKDRLQVEETVAELHEGIKLQIVDLKDLKNGETYALIDMEPFNNLYTILNSKGKSKGDVKLFFDPETENASGKFAYSSYPDVLWTLEINEDVYYLKNNDTNVYLELNEGTGKGLIPAISNIKGNGFKLTNIEGNPSDLNQPYTYIKNNVDEGSFLTLFQYNYSSSVEGAEDSPINNSPQPRKFVFAKVLEEFNPEDMEITIPAGKDNEVYYGGPFSYYQGSSHELTDTSIVNAFILMKPESTESSFTLKNNSFDVALCGDAEADMDAFEEPRKYTQIPLSEVPDDVVSPEQKLAIEGFLREAYPWKDPNTVIENARKYGFEISEYCGPNELLAGTQAALWTITNPVNSETGEPYNWAYESSNGYGTNSYELAKTNDYIGNPELAAQDINNIRDYLLTLATQASLMPMADDGDPTTPEDVVKYDFETLNVETIENEDGSYSLVFSGSLNQNVRNYEYHKYDAWFSDYFSIEIMNDRGDFLGYYDIPQGEKDFLITIDDYNPVDKITLYAYYEMSGIGDIVYNESDGEYQTLYSINSFLGKYKKEYTNILIMKEWDDDLEHNEDVIVDLYMDNVKTDKFITLNPENEYCGIFDLLEANHIYDIQERPIKGYSPTYSTIRDDFMPDYFISYILAEGKILTIEDFSSYYPYIYFENYSETDEIKDTQKFFFEKVEDGIYEIKYLRYGTSPYSFGNLYAYLYWPIAENEYDSYTLRYTSLYYDTSIDKIFIINEGTDDRYYLSSSEVTFSYIDPSNEENNNTYTDMYYLGFAPLGEVFEDRMDYEDGSYETAYAKINNFTCSIKDPRLEITLITNTLKIPGELTLEIDKEIDSVLEDFYKIKLNQDNDYLFKFDLTETTTGNIINGILKNNDTLIIKNIPQGTYIITEHEDLFFDYFSLEALNNIDSISLTNVNGEYILTVGELEENSTLKLKIINKTEDNRLFEDKKDIINIFKVNISNNESEEN